MGMDYSFSLYFLCENFVWYKSKDLERIKDVYRGTTVLCNLQYLSVLSNISLQKILIVIAAMKY
jgi:hypothetical protein